MGSEITHDEAEAALSELRVQLHDWAPAKANFLRDYIAQQRAASVRVVRVAIKSKDVRHYKQGFWLEPGQELAIIERRAEAAAGEGE